jgi:dynein heavy chain
LLNKPRELLIHLKKYDRNNINPKYIKNIEAKCKNHPDFTNDRAKDCSIAVKYLFNWIMAMYDYNRVYLETAPLRIKLENVNRVVTEKTEELRVKNQLLSAIK